MPTALRLDKRASITALLTTGWVAFALLALLGDGAAGSPGGGLYAALMASAIAACAWRAFTTPSERLAWGLMASAIAAWTLGNLYWDLAVSPGRAASHTPSPADALFLAFYPLAYATLVVLVRHRAGLASRDLWVDGVIGASCATALAVAVAVPAFDVPDDDLLALATSVAYPILDAVLLSFVVLVFGLSGWRPGRRWGLIGLGLAAMMVADASYFVEATSGTYSPDGLLDAGWPLAALLLALAAWQPVATPAARNGSDRRLVLVPFGCGLVALSLVTLTVFDALPRGAALPALLTLLLVTARMGMAFVEGQRMMDANRREALTDGLTGLANRRALLADLERAVARATVEEPRVCIVLDLDGFKAYNDAFGHPAGDRLLNRLGQRLHDAVADRGAAYRLGGDEFCVLARGGAGGARALAEMARAALSERGEAFAVTSSAGVVEIPADAGTPSDVLQVADRRMYADKGRRSCASGQRRRLVPRAADQAPMPW